MKIKLLSAAALLLQLLTSVGGPMARADDESQLAIKAEAAKADTPKSEPFIRVTGASMSGGQNEGGRAGRVALSFQIKGNEKYHIGASELTIAAIGGFNSHVNLDATLIPIQLPSFQSQRLPGQPKLSFSFHTLDINEDSDLLVHDFDHSNVMTIFSSPLSTELALNFGRLHLLAEAIAGPAGGFTCTARGCVALPVVTPIVGGSLIARIDLTPNYLLEGAGGGTYLISTDHDKYGTNNYKAEAHGYLIRKYRGNEFYTGAQFTADSKDIKKVGDSGPSADYNFTFFGVVGVTLDAEAARKAR